MTTRICLAALLLLLPGMSSVEAADTPNIVIVLADDKY